MRLLLVACLFSGCLSSEIEPQVTITQGLYGQLTEACTGENCLGKPRIDARLAWFEVSPFSKTADGGRPEPLFETRSKTNGFFELALEPAAKGYLTIGSSRSTRDDWFTATATSIPRGLGRVDWQAGPEDQGTWTDVK